VKFKKDAHMLSEFLGNHTLLYDSECDECNQKFGVYEDHFSKYVGVARTFLCVKGKEKIPKFKSPGGNVVFESSVAEDKGATISVKRTEVLDQSFQIDREKMMQSIHFTKHPYIPLKVYKALLKMALGCVPSAEIDQYRKAFEFVTSDDHDSKLRHLSTVYRYAMPYSFAFTRPTAFLYRKRVPGSPLFTHIFVLSTLNYIYELPIPLYAPDIPFYSGEGINVPMIPPLFENGYPFPSDTIRFSILDLSSVDTVKGEKEVVSFPIPKEVLEGLRSVDPITGEEHIAPFEPSEINGMEFIRGAPLPPHDTNASLITTSS